MEMLKCYSNYNINTSGTREKANGKETRNIAEMKNFQDFPIDKWVQHIGPMCPVALHGSFPTALSLNDLKNLAPSSSQAPPVDLDQQLAYGTAQGSPQLRRRIAELHSPPPGQGPQLTEDNVVIAPGSIMANFLALSAILAPGDHVVCQYPTYGQLYLLPGYSGVDVSLWAMEEADGWRPDVSRIAGLIRPNTKAIILNNPNNPTGAVLSKHQLEQIRDLAREKNITLFADEVFAPLFFNYNDDNESDASPPPPPPLVTLGYERSVSTGSLSKAYSLPGIRIGWIVSPDAALIRRVMTLRDYTTISVSLLDQGVAAFALSAEVLPRIIARNVALCKESVSLIEEFVGRSGGRCTWVRPRGAGVAFIKFLRDDAGGKEKEPVDDRAFSQALAEREGISSVPGELCFSADGRGDFKGYVRLTLGEPERLRKHLRTIEAFHLKSDF